MKFVNIDMYHHSKSDLHFLHVPINISIINISIIKVLLLLLFSQFIGVGNVNQPTSLYTPAFTSSQNIELHGRHP